MPGQIQNPAFPDGGVKNTALAADPDRRSVMIHVHGDSDMWFNWTGNAGNGTGFLLLGKTNNVGGKTGERRTMYVRDWPQIVRALSSWCADTGALYTIETDVR